MEGRGDGALRNQHVSRLLVRSARLLFACGDAMKATNDVVVVVYFLCVFVLVFLLLCTLFLQRDGVPHEALPVDRVLAVGSQQR